MDAKQLQGFKGNLGKCLAERSSQGTVSQSTPLLREVSGALIHHVKVDAADVELLLLPGRLRHFPSSGKRAPASGLEAGHWARQTLSLTGITFLMILCRFSSPVPIRSSRIRHSLQLFPSAEKQHYSVKNNNNKLYKK